jgi:hypothetical protein
MKTMDYGHEGQNLEFKSSFVYPAKNNSQFAHDRDQAFVVFRAACAMMNAEGGKISGIRDLTFFLANAQFCTSAISEARMIARPYKVKVTQE